MYIRELLFGLIWHEVIEIDNDVGFITNVVPMPGTNKLTIEMELESGERNSYEVELDEDDIKSYLDPVA